MALVTERRNRHQAVLSQTKWPGPLSLTGTARFLNRIFPDDHLGRSTLEKLIKITVILGDLPLSPSAIRVEANGKWKYRLRKIDVATVFDVIPQILKDQCLNFNEAFQKTQRQLKKERESRTPIESLMPSILQRLGDPVKISKARQNRIKKALIERLQERKLPLPEDVRPQEILVLGIFTEDQEEIIDYWAEFIEEERKKMEKPTVSHIFKNWPSLTGFLKEQLGPEAKVPPRRLHRAVNWLHQQGISITKVARRSRTYYRPSPPEQDQLESLLQNPANKEELRRIFEKEL